jgi:hypothetical protein
MISFVFHLDRLFLSLSADTCASLVAAPSCVEVREESVRRRDGPRRSVENLPVGMRWTAHRDGAYGSRPNKQV